MVLQLDFDVGKRDDGKVHVHAAVAQFDHLGGESRVCRFHIAVAGFVYQAEKGVKPKCRCMNFWKSVKFAV